MSDFFYKQISEHIDLKEKDIDLLNAFFQSKKILKGSYLLREGEICRNAFFVLEGLFRTFIIDEHGNEHILQFSMRGWWAGDLASFITNEPSKFNVEALEDSEILWISKSSWEILLEKIPQYVDYHRKLLEKGLFVTQNRLIESFSVDAKIKYQNLIKTFPDIFTRVPQYMIASYLGMSRETLSRVRSQLAAQKKS